VNFHRHAEARELARLRNERRRDNQQWMLDWMVKTTGRTQNFAYDQRLIPPEVKSYKQIPRTLEKYARHAEEIGLRAEKAGHTVTAAKLFSHACELYREAQHAIFEDDNPDKIYLHGKLLECHQKVATHADHPVERVEIPFEGQFIQGVLHLVPEGKAPTVLFCPGMDMTKEAEPDTLDHAFVKRGMNCLQIDGPGQGTSNIRKIRVTLDNYERAASAAIDFLSQRSEVDTEAIGVAGYSMGSYWAMRIAATDRRVRAVASAAACYSPKLALFDQASPRFKQVFMYMAGLHDEDEFDRLAESMTLEDLAPLITCPTLMVVGEYDPLAHLDEVIEIFERLRCPRELWVVENDFHNPGRVENFATVDIYMFLADWLRDALAGRMAPDMKRKMLIPDRSGHGPYSAQTDDFTLLGRLGNRTAGAGLTAAQAGPDRTIQR
jgi:pimeloyl-ACP methyl ester carboxylesterase